MSHFTVMVIGNEPEEQLEPFSEQIEVDEYEVDLVSEEERDRFEAVYTVHDPNRTYAILSESEVEENNKLSFDELYEKYGENWNGNSWRKNEEGEWAEFSTYNPKSKWDWFHLGGRWSGMIKLEEGAEGTKGDASFLSETEAGIDSALKGDIANLEELTTFALLKDGQWYERGEMGWFGIASNEKDQEEWDKEFSKLLNDLPDDTLISIYDCHI